VKKLPSTAVKNKTERKEEKISNKNNGCEW
jgi:hypothetical protein